MAVIAISFFVTVSWLAVKMDARPSSTTSVLSQIARGAFPAGSPGSIGYYLVQAFTLAILVLAANTSYQGFPRLAALLARDRFLPSQFVNLGDRLAYSNGIIVLAGLATLPAGRLPGERQLADPPLRDRRLHRVHARPGGHGAPLAEDAGARLALAGRAQRARRCDDRARDRGRGRDEVPRRRLDGADRDPGARARLLRRAPPLPRRRPPAAREGAAPSSAAARSRTTSSSTSSGSTPRPARRSGTRRRSRRSRCARSTCRSRAATRASARASSTGPTAIPRLEILPADGDRLDAVLEEIWAIPQGESRYVTVVVPELFRKPSLLSAVMRRSTFSLKLGLLREPGVAVTDVPKLGDDDFLPQRAEVVVPISGRATRPRCARCCTRARSGSARRRAVYFAERRRRGGRDRARLAPLPDRTPAGDRRGAVPRRRHAAAHLPSRITADPDAVAVVVMPELVVRGT